MEPKQSEQIIEAAGGDAAFARLLGLDTAKKGTTQRVNNWKRRGIPPGVVLENLEVIRRLEQQAGELAA
jgi:hypothetical protein